MKLKLFLILPLNLIFLISIISCDKQPNDISVGEVKNVFELQYGKLIKLTIDDKEYSFMLENVNDSVDVNCSLVDFKDNTIDPLKISIHAYLSVNSSQTLLKVNSKQCGALPYTNNGTDIQDINNKINAIKSSGNQLNNKDYYNQTFMSFFGTGSLIPNSVYRIYIAKAFPIGYEVPNASLSDYKFIFIITKQS
jgi:hypothetical protein